MAANALDRPLTARDLRAYTRRSAAGILVIIAVILLAAWQWENRRQFLKQHEQNPRHKAAPVDDADKLETERPAHRPGPAGHADH
jgi:hypothetical protein